MDPELLNWRADQAEQKQSEVREAEAGGCEPVRRAFPTRTLTQLGNHLQLAAIVDRHQEHICELFHMEQYVTLVDYDPETAKRKPPCQ